MARSEMTQFSCKNNILRFLNRDGLFKTLGIGQDPSILIKQLEYYQELEEDDRGDKYENKIITKHPKVNVDLISTNLNPIFISCWSCYKNSDLSTYATWNALPNSIAAIESTVGAVEEIIYWTNREIIKSVELAVQGAGKSFLLKSGIVHHQKIVYYSPQDNELHQNNPWKPFNCFNKREPYSKQKEYRFAIIFGSQLKEFLPEKFFLSLTVEKAHSYIKTIYFKSAFFTKNERQLLNIHCPHLIRYV